MRELISVFLSICIGFSQFTYASDMLEFESATPQKKLSQYTKQLELPFDPNTPNTYPQNSSQGTDPHLVIQAPLPNGETAQITAVEKEISSTAEIEALLSKPELKDTPIIVSTDQEQVLTSVVKAASNQNDKRALRFIPLGKLASAKDKMAAGFKSYYTNARNTLTGDPIGLTVLIITVGVDSIIWLNAGSFTFQQKTAMILMNLVMAASFGLDRELWGKMTAPLKGRLLKIFDKFLVTENFTDEKTQKRITKTKTIVNQYVTSFIFGMGVQVTRVGLLSLDSISHAVQTTQFWLEAMKIASLVTLATFTWSEMYSATDSETQPVAKRMLRRLSEFRGIIMCQLASISMVLQPMVYGMVPIVSFIVHAAIGAIFLWKKDKFIHWLQHSPTVYKAYRKIQTFEHFVLTMGGRRAFKCRMLFQSY